MQKVDEYLGCLDLGTEKLQDLFTKDETRWTLHLKKTEKGLPKMTETLTVFLADQERKLAEILNPAQFTKTKFILKKLAMWGEKVRDDEINFEWPTKEILEELEEV